MSERIMKEKKLLFTMIPILLKSIKNKHFCGRGELFIQFFIICQPTKNEQGRRLAVAFCNYNTCIFIFASQLGKQ